MASGLPTTQAPGKEDYAGDEINALVLDPGSFSTRAGFAGEDTPKSVVPTFYGSLESGERIFGENAIYVPRGDMEIKNPYNTDGLVEDWETAAKLWEYSIISRLTGPKQTPAAQNGLNDPATDGDGDVKMDVAETVENQEKPLSEYPLLVTEPAWNPTKSRERTIEIAMEQWGAPAFFLAKTGQLAAYASGKASALVIDVGHHNTSVTALWEGMVLKKSIHRTPVAGNYLSEQIRMLFAQHDPVVPLVPHYMIKSKTPVDANAPSNAQFVQFDKAPKESFRKMEEDRVIRSFKESVVQTWQGPGRLTGPASQGPGGSTNMDYAKSLPAKPFEIPDGWNTVFGAERFKVAEPFFAHDAAYSDDTHPAITGEQTVTQIAHKALQACDIDARATLLNNIILTGAGSLVEKFADRLQLDMQTLYPNPKVRVIASGNSAERKFGAWIGGSVLASLGTFHQMWISQEEYKEYGPEIVEKRCK